MENKTYVLELQHIFASYGNISALENISMNVGEGEIVILIGPHGSGKTTVLKVVYGMLAAARGNIYLKGKRTNNLPTEKLVEIGMAYVDERKLLFPSMTVLDNLILGAYHLHKNSYHYEVDDEMKSVFELFPVIGQRTEQTAGTLSGGEQQMLAIGRALMSQPKLLMLDCPSLGLAPIMVDRVTEAIIELKRRGIAILMVEQNVPFALNIADRGYIMEKGSIVSEGAADTLVELLSS